MWRRSILTLSALVAATLAIDLPIHLPIDVPMVSAAAADSGPCEQVSVPVSLAPGQSAAYRISGTLCRPPGWGAGHPGDLDVLLPGATYTRSYWDWPTSAPTYSWVDRTLQSGRATLDVDRIGSGASSHPSGAALNLVNDAYTVHQVVTWARRGLPVDRITLIGHSLGSGVAVVEAATFHDVDRLVLTGMLHSVGSGLAGALTTFQPVTLATLLAAPAGSSLSALLGTLVVDGGYLTTAAGSRQADFFSATADPAVVAFDEAHKDVVAATELGGYPTLLLPPPLDGTRLVDVPVLAVAGQQDALVCGGTLDCTDPAAVRANEVAFYPLAPSVDTLTVPLTGHDVALHPSAGSTFADVDRWIANH